MVKTEDPHVIETEIEKMVKELESSDESNKQEVVRVPNKDKPVDEDDKSYEDKTKEEWKKNDFDKNTRLTYTEDEIDVLEEDF